ncbi:hypothetical protein SAMN06295905_2947 [Devosia lucknowensis]|uniref:Uncharacterized protein n=1 Tax=Devosia lucknowensis TaxID=1096929 RepID=A0A1Y6GC59_9HYPH|nr:hypothetical protein [Devosia lucknowensis]SMQ85659.1 hypothetical protein SAMN06295905_2947 [Devosia lucknowensis]
MRGLLAYLSANAADLLINLAFFLIVYLIARILKAGPMAALVIAAIPMVAIAFLLNPMLPPRLMAMLR